MRSLWKAFFVLLLAGACVMCLAMGCGDDGGTDPVIDTDGDGVADSDDNCPSVANANQLNTDGDSEGNACDTDDDNDGVLDATDNCPLVSNPNQEDANSNGVGDACEGDMDGDGVPDGADNCPLVPNPDQADADSDGIGDACEGDPTPCDEAALIVATANDSLGRQMYELIEITLDDPDSTFRPRDVDFSGLNGLYQQATALCATNIDASFGLAFTGLMVFLQDETMNDFIDRMKYVFDTLNFYPPSPLGKLPGVPTGGSMTLDGMPLATGDIFRVLPAFYELDRAVMRVAAGDPMISEFQTIIETSLLPKVVQARTYMDKVLNYPDYTFTVTPMMQGNAGADNVVLDRSDFEVIQSCLYGAEAGLHIFLARDLDLTEYSDAGITTALDQASSFLSLKEAGAGLNHMQTAKSRILSAADHAETALINLIAEIGTDQFDDLIQVYPNDLEDLQEIKDSLAHYRTYFDGPIEWSIVYNEDWYEWWDGEIWHWEYEADTFAATVDISQFFDNPMNNPKLFLPGYTITIEAISGAFVDFADAHFSRSKYWTAMEIIYGLTFPYDTADWSGDTISFLNHLPDGNTSEFYHLLYQDSWNYGSWTDVGRQQFVFGWDDEYFSGGDQRYVWNYYSDNMYDYRYLYQDPDRIIICYAWTASNWAEWEFPDPTFNGLLPNMDNAQLKDHILNIEPGFWHQSDCDTVSVD